MSALTTDPILLRMRQRPALACSKRGCPMVISPEKDPWMALSASVEGGGRRASGCLPCDRSREAPPVTRKEEGK